VATVIAITGASAGVGRATALAFAQPGARIALMARSSEGLRDAAREVEARGAEALAVPVDVASPEGVEHAAQEIEDTLGPIDVWVNNAMVSVFSRAIDMTPLEFRRVTDVTYLGYVWGTLAALRRMRTRGGTILQVSSALAFRSIPLQSAYCAAKHAIKGFTESLRTELLHDGVPVHVGMVHLPAINTTQFEWVRSRLPRRPQPVPPIYQPEVAARAIVWAATHHKRDLWVGWPVAKAIVGERVAPGAIDHYLAARGFDSQQTDEPEPERRRDNLLAPVRGVHATHGRFDARAHRRSPFARAARHKKALAAGAAVIAALWALAGCAGDGLDAEAAARVDATPPAHTIEKILHIVMEKK
jgi:NAD(P)-dependent dehydrogenase (short-subunit alcohol dehydrogenase family)